MTETECPPTSHQHRQVTSPGLSTTSQTNSLFSLLPIAVRIESLITWNSCRQFLKRCHVIRRCPTFRPSDWLTDGLPGFSPVDASLTGSDCVTVGRVTWRVRSTATPPCVRPSRHIAYDLCRRRRCDATRAVEMRIRKTSFVATKLFMARICRLASEGF